MAPMFSYAIHLGTELLSVLLLFKTNKSCQIVDILLNIRWEVDRQICKFAFPYKLALRAVVLGN